MHRRTFLSALLACALAAGCAAPQMLRPPRAHSTLEHTVMVGYQGWYRTPGDGADLGWSHYRGRGGAFAPGKVGIDYWPDVSELAPDGKAATPLRQADGSAAYVFSSHNAQTVDRHFRWMQDYGIDGAFVQRFAAEVTAQTAFGRRRAASVDDVLGYARAGAEHHGRSFAVMYDLSGLGADRIDSVIRDWKHVVDDLRVRESPAYQFHRGHPLVAVWGVGFNDGRAYTLADCARLIEFLKHDPIYGGNTVMLGVPTWWREQVADAVRDPQLHEVIAQADVLSPWTPGRYYDAGGVRVHAARVWQPDRAWCAARGIDYLPVVFPGFSWRNLKGVHGGIERADGRFLWEQYRVLANAGGTMFYQAMFDEMDEGTQIFKATNTPPAGTFFRRYAPLPPDYYLWLVGQAAGLVHANRPLPARIPPHPDATIEGYLRAGDAAAEAATRDSFETQQRLADLSAALDVADGGWVFDRATRGRVRVSGGWGAHHVQSRDPAAAVVWRFDVAATGDYAVQLRAPGDPDEVHATAARLRVLQAQAMVAGTSLNLRSAPLHWHDVTRVRLAAASPCEVIIDQPAVSGALTLVEIRLRPVEGN